jgi:hypothetical protein
MVTTEAKSVVLVAVGVTAVAEIRCALSAAPQPALPAFPLATLCRSKGSRLARDAGAQMSCSFVENGHP